MPNKTLPNKTQTAPKLALREREAADALGVSVKTLRNWRYMVPVKGPRPSRIGRAVVYPVAEIERYLADHMDR